MDASLIAMGYRGEDASRTRAASRRQRPRQSSSDPRGYGQEDAYAPAGEDGGYDGHGHDDSYAGYDAYDQHAGYDQQAGHNGYDRDGYGHDGFDHDDYPDGQGYGQDDGYGYPQSGYAGSGGQPAAPGGYGSGGYPAQADGYGGSGGYPTQRSGYARSGGQPALPGRSDSSGGYPAQGDSYSGSGGYPAQGDSYSGSGGYPAQGDGYSASGGYPAQGDGYSGSGGYPAQRGGYGQSGGQPALPGRHDTSGGYPVQGGGSSQEDVPGRYAGNDWYGRPGGASGSGFADTGTFNLDARAIESYAAGLRSPAQAGQEPGAPQGLVHTGQQEQYDGLVHTGQQERYDDQYEAYPGYESQGDYEDTRGYHAPQGYDQGFDQGYDQNYDEQDDYADPYEGRYGDDDTAPRPPGKDGKPGKKTGGGKRGKRPLVLAALAVVLVGIAAAAVYVFALKPKPAADSATSTGPLPSPGTTSAATAACVKQLGEYCHIELRTDDPKPLTLDEVYPPAFTNETDHGSFTRVGTKLDTTCSNAVIGQDLVTALQNAKCNQVLRASYVSGDNKIMGTIGVANLSTTNEAHEAGRLVGTNDFVAPLSTTSGVGKKLGQGTGIVEAEYKGHYLIMVWVEFTSTSAPANNTQDQQLQQFGSDLIAGTANIDLSQRMINGDKATASS